MNDREFEERIKNCSFLKQIFAELIEKQRQRDAATTEALMLIANAATQQLDRTAFVQAVNSASRALDSTAPNPIRADFIDAITAYLTGNPAAHRPPGAH